MDAVVQRLFIVRHGDRYDRTVAYRQGGCRPVLHSEDPPLSDLGLRQAAAAGMALAARVAPGRVGWIVASPYLRTVQTADCIAAGLALAGGQHTADIFLEPGLGEAGAHNFFTVTPSERAAYFPRVDPAYVACVAVAPGEAFPGAFLRRCRAAAEALARQLSESAAGGEQRLADAVLVTHAATAIAVTAAMAGLSLGELQACQTTGIYELHRLGSGAIRLAHAHSDTGHLTALPQAETRAWSFCDDHPEVSWQDAEAAEEVASPALAPSSTVAAAAAVTAAP
jgi:broad specificity phosphatase PhoE